MSSATGTPRYVPGLSPAGTAATSLSTTVTWSPVTWLPTPKRTVVGVSPLVPVPGARRATNQKLSVSNRVRETNSMTFL